jgi:hypothetical protein
MIKSTPQHHMLATMLKRMHLTRKAVTDTEGNGECEVLIRDVGLERLKKKRHLFLSLLYFIFRMHCIRCRRGKQIMKS